MPGSDPSKPWGEPDGGKSRRDGASALSLSGIDASAGVTSGYANHAAFAEKSVGKPTFAATGASAASVDDKHSGRRSSELRP